MLYMSEWWYKERVPKILKQGSIERKSEPSVASVYDEIVSICEKL